MQLFNHTISLILLLQSTIERKENITETSDLLKSDGTENIAVTESRKVTDKTSKKKSSAANDGSTTGQKKKVKKSKKTDSEKENISVVSSLFPLMFRLFLKCRCL